MKKRRRTEKKEIDLNRETYWEFGCGSIFIYEICVVFSCFWIESFDLIDEQGRYGKAEVIDKKAATVSQTICNMLTSPWCLLEPSMEESRSQRLPLSWRRSASISIGHCGTPGPNLEIRPLAAAGSQERIWLHLSLCVYLWVRRSLLLQCIYKLLHDPDYGNNEHGLDL
ncbi:hypothetical protein NE237_027457 [Protea cynaroides]|uniref:Uncharacterized protein n=1 Tax=Protea cynaroides TaxID=273540 RepID=A0A9Q0GNG1_9MAGN|nr:hypothetical protein NE237_027457 [Protea cynaroides]